MTDIEALPESPIVVSLKKRILVVFCVVHVVALAVSTYLASIQIETILVSGFVCSATGLLLAITAMMRGRRLLAIAAGMTPLLALTLFVAEVNFLKLGPQGAALPFCIAFLINQTITTSVIIIELHLLLANQTSRRWQVTLKTLLVLMTGFAICSGGAHFLLKQEHTVLMLLALGLLGLTFVGLLSAACTAAASRKSLLTKNSSKQE